MRHRPSLTRPKATRRAPWGDRTWDSPVTTAPPRPPIDALEAFGCVLIAAMADGLRSVQWEGPGTWVVTLADGRRVSVVARVEGEFEQEVV